MRAISLLSVNTLPMITVDVVELIFSGIGLVILPILVLVYSRINARRAVLIREMEEKGLRYNAEELRSMGDRAPDFVYTL